ADKRRLLQEFIKEFQDPYIELNHNIMLLTKIIESITELLNNTLESIQDKDLFQNNLELIFNNFKEKNKKAIKEITFEKSKEFLKEKDEKRGFWTNER
ncbi:13429_t:CDS:1, partial [Dentiscutata erythropus]